MKICDEITVMRDGRHIATKSTSGLTMDEIIKLMVGRELTTRFPEKNNKPSGVIMRVENLTAKHNFLSDVSFELKSGEILGVAGLAGSGRTEILETLFGLSEKSRGDVYIHGNEVKISNPRDAINNGLALVTEERRSDGIFGILSILENTTISNLEKYRLFNVFLNKSEMKKDTRWSIESMKIKTPSDSTQIRTLSGGNQQKVIFGRWLLTNPEILLLDEPTRGIDVGAKYDIYKLITEMACSGKGVIMVSSEMPELLGVCDRIMVMSGGKVAGILDASTASQEDIMKLAAKYA